MLASLGSWRKGLFGASKWCVGVAGRSCVAKSEDASREWPLGLFEEEEEKEDGIEPICFLLKSKGRLAGRKLSGCIDGPNASSAEEPLEYPRRITKSHDRSLEQTPGCLIKEGKRVSRAALERPDKVRSGQLRHP